MSVGSTGIVRISPTGDPRIPFRWFGTAGVVMDASGGTADVTLYMNNSSLGIQPQGLFGGRWLWDVQFVTAQEDSRNNPDPYRIVWYTGELYTGTTTLMILRKSGLFVNLGGVLLQSNIGVDAVMPLWGGWKAKLDFKSLGGASTIAGIRVVVENWGVGPTLDLFAGGYIYTPEVSGLQG